MLTWLPPIELEAVNYDVDCVQCLRGASCDYNQRYTCIRTIYTPGGDRHFGYLLHAEDKFCPFMELN
jgi:hypothetical protein